MSKRKHFVQGGMWLTLAFGLSSILSFVRNVVLARLLSVEDYGVASLFAITMSVIEMLSNIAIDKLLIQSNGNNLTKLQSVGQAFQFVRGLSSGVILFFLAGHIAQFFHVPHAEDAFKWFALVPVIRGLAHLDIQLVQRELKFKPLAFSTVIPHFTALLGLVICSQVIHDYTLIVWSILIQNVSYVAITFYYAEKKYEWDFDSDIFKEIIKFGWPLLANGILMFIIMQGDKAVIGAFFTTRELGWYSAAFALTLAPALLITRLLSSLLLPVLSKQQNDSLKFHDHYVLTMQTCYLSGMITALFFILFGSDLVTIIFGSAYQEAAQVVVWLGLMQAVRIVKSGPMIVAMARAETKNALMSNIVRALSFSFLLGAVFWLKINVNQVALLGLLGECLALIMSFYYLKSRLDLFSLQVTKQLLSLILLISFSLFAAASNLFPDNHAIKFLINFVIFFATVSFYYFFSLNTLKNQISSTIRSVYSKR